MKINAVFFDIDGTFFDHVSGMVLPETLTAVKKLRENGYKVCLCSGRAKEMAEQLGVLQMTAWDGYVGGAGVSVYNERMELISEHAFTREQTARIFELGRQYDICIQSHGTYEFMTKPLNPYARQTFAEFHCEVPEVRDWHEEALVAISAYERKGFDWSMFDDIEGIELQHPNDTCVDFMQCGINKATGIRELMDFWGFPHDSYMAFGDSLNDMEMIQEAAYGIVMGNGKDALKPYADLVIGPSNEPGIYHTLKELHMID